MFYTSRRIAGDEAFAMGLADLLMPQEQVRSLGIGCKIFGSLGAQWFYQGESLGYRTFYLWIADQDLMITVQTNSQPAEGTDKLGEAVNTLYEIVRKSKAN